MSRAGLLHTDRPPWRATVISVAVVVPKNFKCSWPHTAVGALSYDRSSPGGVIIAATRCPHSVDADVLPQRRLT